MNGEPYQQHESRINNLKNLKLIRHLWKKRERKKSNEGGNTQSDLRKSKEGRKRKGNIRIPITIYVFAYLFKMKPFSYFLVFFFG